MSTVLRAGRNPSSVSHMVIALCDNMEAVVGSRPDHVCLTRQLYKRLRDECKHNDATPILRDFYGMKIVIHEDDPEIFSVQVTYEDG